MNKLTAYDSAGNKLSESHYYGKVAISNYRYSRRKKRSLFKRLFEWLVRKPGNL